MPALPPHHATALLPARLAAEAVTALRFYTRLPLPRLAVEAAHPPEPFALCLRWAPLAGAVVGLAGGALLAGARALGLPAPVAAVLALSGTVALGGGLHEDGLADLADGFGGGSTRERKLAIMRDSRLGSYGAIALVLSLLLRVACLTALIERGTGPAVTGLVAVAAASRGLGLWPMARLSPARADGLGHGAGRLPGRVVAVALAGAVVLALAAPLAGGTTVTQALSALAFAAAAAVWTTRLARRQIGGFTGDVAGACQQVCEIAMLLGLLTGTATG